MKNKYARLTFCLYIVFVTVAYIYKQDRLVMLAMAVLAGLGYLWRVMYVEDSENIIQFFDGRIREVIEKLMKAIDETNKRIDKHHPNE